MAHVDFRDLKPKHRVPNFWWLTDPLGIPMPGHRSRTPTYPRQYGSKKNKIGCYITLKLLNLFLFLLEAQPGLTFNLGIVCTFIQICKN